MPKDICIVELGCDDRESHSNIVKASFTRTCQHLNFSTVQLFHVSNISDTFINPIIYLTYNIKNIIELAVLEASKQSIR